MSHLNKTQVGGTHYASKTVQPWEAMQSWMSHDEFTGFLRGNVIKYIARCNEKGGIEDLKKARHYLDKLIETLETKTPTLNTDDTAPTEYNPVKEWVFFQIDRAMQRGESGLQKGDIVCNYEAASEDDVTSKLIMHVLSDWAQRKQNNIPRLLSFLYKNGIILRPKEEAIHEAHSSIYTFDIFLP